MASPQKENGYTPIANELLEAIYGVKLNATQMKILLVICRYTYGFSRISHSLSLSFLAHATGFSTRQISKELSLLISNKVVKVISQSTFSTSRILALNKNYEQWGCSHYFIPRGRIDIEYCNRIASGETKPCYQIGAMKLHQATKSEDLVYQAYQKAYRRMNSRARQRKITQTEFLSWSDEARRKRDDCSQDKLSLEVYL
ncbi:MAG: replication protein [Oscillospiraceae bacterium]